MVKSWGENVHFDVRELRDRRMRALHGQRYDHRTGLVDWDYNATIKPAASIIHGKLYRHWRETGVAFEFGDQTYTVPNRSMASYAEGREGGRSQCAPAGVARGATPRQRACASSCQPRGARLSA